MPRSSNGPKQPKGLAAFVAQASKPRESTEDAIYEALCQQWRQMYKQGDRRTKPSSRTIGETVGVGAGHVAHVLAEMAVTGRLVRHGTKYCAVYVPNEAEFTGGDK